MLRAPERQPIAICHGPAPSCQAIPRLVTALFGDHPGARMAMQASKRRRMDGTEGGANPWPGGKPEKPDLCLMPSRPVDTGAAALL